MRDYDIAARPNGKLLWQALLWRKEVEKPSRKEVVGDKRIKQLGVLIKRLIRRSELAKDFLLWDKRMQKISSKVRFQVISQYKTKMLRL